jgi:hypothetical protein
MAMSKDRIRFFLPFLYFQISMTRKGMHRVTCAQVLVKAFGHSVVYWYKIMDRSPEGFYIVCRPSQFARFIVFRAEAGECVNGIKDLEPKLLSPEDKYMIIADKAGVDYERTRLVMKVLESLEIHKDKLDDIDVSGEPYIHISGNRDG